MNDLKIGDVFSSRQQLIELGLHSDKMRGMGKKQTVNGQEYIFSIVMSDYPDNMYDGDNLFYSGEGGYNSELGKITKNQDFQTAANKKMLVSINIKAPIMLFIKSTKGFVYSGNFIPTHYMIKRGKDGFIIIDFHLKKEESINELCVNENTKSIKVVLTTNEGNRKRIEINYPEINNYLNKKILDRIEYQNEWVKIYDIVN